MSMKTKYVIIGGGIASLGCIDGIRKKDKDGEITLICGENTLPYARPLISYYLENKTDTDKMQYRSEAFYKENGVRVLKGIRAEKIENEKVFLENGETAEFEKALVATGSSPFVPPIKGLENVKNRFSFMTVSDALALEKAVNKESRVLIIGAGLIGLKCAEGLCGRAGKITVCDLAPHLMPSVLDSECAAPVEKKFKEMGIELIFSDSIESIENGTAKTKNGLKTDFDILVTAVGVRPNISLLKDIGAETERGVIVNEKMQTSIENIYAAGDMAEGFDITKNKKSVTAILPNAYIGGFCAGENMAGKEAVFDNIIPMNSIGFFGCHLMTAGTYEGELYEEKTENAIKKLYVKDNRLIGFMLVGNVDKAGIYTSLIRNKTPLDTMNFDNLKKNPSLLPFSFKYRRKNLGGVL